MAPLTAGQEGAHQAESEVQASLTSNHVLDPTGSGNIRRLA